MFKNTPQDRGVILAVALEREGYHLHFLPSIERITEPLTQQRVHCHQGAVQVFGTVS